MDGRAIREKLEGYSEFHGIDIRTSELGGYGMFASKDLDNDAVVLRVPKTSVLSPKNSGIADFLAEQDEIEPSIALILAFLYETNQKTSKWSNFISQLSECELPDIPSLWSPDEQQLLKNTNFQLWVDSDEMEDVYRSITPLLKQLKPQMGHLISLPEWREASLVISSRSFDVDNYHGLSLVPGACIANHSDKEDLHFESNADVCFDCGTVGCDCDSWDDESSDGCNDAEEPRGEDPEEYKICEMRLLHAVKAGTELHNTYGEDPNAILLSRYGFCIWNNRHDIVDFEKEVRRFSKAANLAKKVNSWRERQEAKVDNGELEDEAAFVGIINDVSGPQCSEGLASLAKCLKLDKQTLVRMLAEERYKNYRVPGSSAEIKEQLATELNNRRRTALTLVGTEKLLLEGVLGSN